MTYLIYGDNMPTDYTLFLSNNTGTMLILLVVLAIVIFIMYYTFYSKRSILSRTAPNNNLSNIFAKELTKETKKLEKMKAKIKSSDEIHDPITSLNQIKLRQEIVNQQSKVNSLESQSGFRSPEDEVLEAIQENISQHKLKSESEVKILEYPTTDNKVVNEPLEDLEAKLEQSFKDWEKSGKKAKFGGKI